MPYSVYLIVSLGTQRDHHAIFVETNPANSSGHIYQVTGNIREGMTYGHKPRPEPPEQSIEFISKEHVGVVNEERYGRVREVVEMVELPGKQFDEIKRLFPGRRLRRCQEWTAEAVEALREAGILEREF